MPWGFERDLAWLRRRLAGVVLSWAVLPGRDPLRQTSVLAAKIWSWYVTFRSLLPVLVETPLGGLSPMCGSLSYHRVVPSKLWDAQTPASRPRDGAQGLRCVLKLDVSPNSRGVD